MSGFTTPDPLADQTPWDNPYAYCGGDPVNRIDLTGKSSGGLEIVILGHDYTKDNNDAQYYANYWSNDHSNPNGGAGQVMISKVHLIIAMCL